MRVGRRGATGLSQPSVSMHLTCLWDCGLVERGGKGRFVYYRIADPRVSALLEAGDRLLMHVGDKSTSARATRIQAQSRRSNG